MASHRLQNGSGPQGLENFQKFTAGKVRFVRIVCQLSCWTMYILYISCRCKFHCVSFGETAFCFDLGCPIPQYCQYFWCVNAASSTCTKCCNNTSEDAYTKKAYQIIDGECKRKLICIFCIWVVTTSNKPSFPIKIAELENYVILKRSEQNNERISFVM